MLKQDVDYFALFSLSPTIKLDRSALESSYRQLIKDHHPDRHINSVAKDHLQSINYTSFINLAYQTLLNPRKRLEYYLSLQGFIVSEYRRQVPLDFLEQVMEWGDTGHEMLRQKNADSLANLIKLIDDKYKYLILNAENLIESKKYVEATIIANQLNFLEKIHNDLDEQYFSLTE